MVWGMRLPDSFGEFWPDGEFEYDPKKKESGWGERLRNHYLSQTPEEQLRLYDYRGSGDGDNTVSGGSEDYKIYVSSKFRFEVGAKNPVLNQLPVKPVERHEIPFSYDTAKTYEKLGSMIEFHREILAVDETLKAIIDRLEPRKHQFFPIEIKMPKGRVFAKTYYILVIGQYLDSYSPEHSDETKKNMTGRAFSRAAFGDANLWRDRRFPKVICFSDGLREEIDKAALRIPKHYKMKEI